MVMIQLNLNETRAVISDIEDMLVKGEPVRKNLKELRYVLIRRYNEAVNNKEV